jgi:hypothetical protein
MRVENLILRSIAKRCVSKDEVTARKLIQGRNPYPFTSGRSETLSILPPFWPATRT